VVLLTLWILLHTVVTSRKLIVVALLTPAMVGGLSFGCRRPVNSRAHWITGTKQELLKIHTKGVPDFRVQSRPYSPVGSPEGYLFALTDGAVRVGHDGWVYIKCHSMHEDLEREDKGLPCIGDVSLAIDHKGRLYAHFGHVCGCLGLRAKSREGFADIEEFIRSPVPPHAQGKQWEPLGLANQSLQTDG